MQPDWGISYYVNHHQNTASSTTGHALSICIPVDVVRLLKDPSSATTAAAALGMTYMFHWTGAPLCVMQRLYCYPAAYQPSG